MRAFAVEQFGDAPAILDLPKPADADAYVVRVTCAGVNPLDCKLADSLTPYHGISSATGGNQWQQNCPNYAG